MKGVTKTERPSFNNHRGRTWDKGTVILHDGTTCDAYLDTTWGTRFYFLVDGQWYVAPIGKYEQGGTGLTLVFDLNKTDVRWNKF